MHGKGWWDVFQEDVAKKYRDDPELLENLQELREWDDIKMRFADGSPMVEFRWRHIWQVKGHQKNLRKTLGFQARRNWTQSQGGLGVSLR